MFHYPLGGRAHVYINGHDLSEFQAKLERDYAMGGCQVENSLNQGPSRSTLLLLRQNFAPLTIRLPLNFYAKTKACTMAHMAAFNALCQGPVELDLSDGFVYHCVLTEIGETAWLGDTFCAADYTFSGIRHKQTATVESAAPIHLVNDGTFPKSDCVITVKNLQCTASVPVIISLSDGETTFLTWKIDTSGGLYQAGGDLVLDGVHKQNRYNGGNIPTGTMAWTDYPYLKPGTNTLSIGGGLTQANMQVQYAPAYL